jgi:hypothetical protein
MASADVNDLGAISVQLRRSADFSSIKFHVPVFAGIVTAAAHKLARILYAMVKHRTPFDPDRLGNPEQSRARKERFLRRQAEQLGFTLTPVE